MKIYIVKNYDELSIKASNILEKQIRHKSDSVIGLATGYTVEGMYKYLVQKYKEGNLDFSNVKALNLDDYKGVKKEDPRSYYYYMKEKLFSKVNINMDNTYIPDCEQNNSQKACEDYDEILNKLGRIDIQILGLGHDGHIGFNEPSQYFSKKTVCVKLSKSTIEANKRYFGKEEDVPKEAYTMGIQTIMQAKKILLLVSGTDKAKILKRVLTNPISPQLPASILHYHHDVVLIADQEASKELDEKLLVSEK